MTTTPTPQDMARTFAAVRAQTEALAAPLSEADCQVQSMPDASPVKWHLAHTTWFFETFVLAPQVVGFQPFDAAFRVLFNSYYNGVGAQHPRAQRGLITRPDLATVRAWRRVVDAQMAELLAAPLAPDVRDLVTLGLQHEQQHQELILTDLLHLLSCNPLAPVYRPAPPSVPAPAADGPAWVAQPGGLVAIGASGTGFAFDNERPRHQVWLAPRPAPAGSGLQQLLGDVWEWTASPYTAYPGYRPWAGAVGEYNGKFMVNQMVLRGGSCATPRSHIRASYRNFFPTEARWQFSGLRLARDDV